MNAWYVNEIEVEARINRRRNANARRQRIAQQVQSQNSPSATGLVMQCAAAAGVTGVLGLEHLIDLAIVGARGGSYADLSKRLIHGALGRGLGRALTRAGSVTVVLISVDVALNDGKGTRTTAKFVCNIN